MVLIAEGVFEMGSNDSEDEKPIRHIFVETFLLDETEVTVAEYRDCVTNGRCSAPGTGTYCNWDEADREHHPINCVDWKQASLYCSAAGGRLPTEAEWEKAARGTDARTYPWGDRPEPSCDHVVMDDYASGGLECGMESTMEVGSKTQGVSPYGAQDMAGNVWEWVADWYDDYDPRDVYDPTGPTNGKRRILRGGSWLFGLSTYFRGSYRFGISPSANNFFVGFRCARTLLAIE
ncbi:MAG: SUMF1/EgtB/PvdO family nonheme iron enzyme [Myxococcota bacterium]